MPEIRSPLTSIIRPGDYGIEADKSIALVLSEKQPGALVQLAGWQDFSEASAPALTALGFEGLGNYRTVRTVDKASCFRIAPDKLLLRHQNSVVLHAALEKLDPACSPTLGLSHARWLIEIEGPEVEALLARLAPLDCTLAEFPQGTFAQTGIYHIGVLLHRVSKEKFEMLVPVSWVVSLWDLICETAAPFAYRVETTQF